MVGERGHITDDVRDHNYKGGCPRQKPRYAWDRHLEKA